MGFDFLRDRLRMGASPDEGGPSLRKFVRTLQGCEEPVQRGHYFALIDEADSILIDEARTPLIISGPTEDKSDLYISVDKIIPSLVAGDYEVDEKSRTITLTEDGMEHLEKLLFF